MTAEEAAAETGFSIGFIRQRCRRAPLVEARRKVVRLLRDDDWSWDAIAKAVDRTRASCIHLYWTEGW